MQRYGKIEISKLKKQFDCRVISSKFLIRNIDLAFDAWEKSPWYNPNEFELFCEYILPYRIGNEPIEECREKYYKDLKSIVDTATSLEGIVLGFHNELNWIRHYKPSQKLWGYPGEIPISKLEIGRRGACRDMTTFGALAMRACGLPVTIDRAIWANRSQGHSWNVLMLENNQIFPFDALDRKRIELAYKPAKIFRRTFSLNYDKFKNISKNDIPSSLFIFDEYDVTHEYVNAYDISVPIQIQSDKYKDKKHRVICVFDNNEWRVVYWGEVKSNNMIFKNIAADVAYFTIEARKEGELKWCRILLNSVLKPPPKYYSYAESLVSLFDKKEKAKGDKELKFVRLDTSDIVYANDTMPTAHVLKEAVIIEKRKKSLSEIVLEDAVEVLDIRQTFDDIKDQAEFETDNIIEFLDRYYPKQFKMDVGTT